MPVSRNDKEAIIDQLENTRTKGSRLVIRLKFAGRNTEAEQAARKVKTLGARIDTLIAQAMVEWSGGAAALVEQLRQTNAALQRDITDIRKKKNLAQKVVSALGRLDEVIERAGELTARL